MLSESHSELWIDLLSLVSSSCTEKGFTTIYYQYYKDENRDETLTYTLRVALRALGYKITKIECVYDDNLNLRLKSYYTNIPPDVWAEARKIESDWIRDTYTDDGYYESDSDESASVVQDESNEDPIIT
jgi:hypothetical protein